MALRFEKYDKIVSELLLSLEDAICLLSEMAARNGCVACEFRFPTSLERRYHLFSTMSTKFDYRLQHRIKRTDWRRLSPFRRLGLVFHKTGTWHIEQSVSGRNVW